MYNMARLFLYTWIAAIEGIGYCNLRGAGILGAVETFGRLTLSEPVSLPLFKENASSAVAIAWIGTDLLLCQPTNPFTSQEECR
jgi:hypothetical protein